MHHPDSAVLAWPAQTGLLADSTIRWWLPDTRPLSSPTYLCCTDLRDWEAVRYKWHSPVWQLGAMQSKRVAPQSCMCFSSVDPRPLLHVLASEAFFDMGVKRLADWLGNATSATDAFDVAFDLVKSILKCDDDVALDICAKRLANKARQTRFSDWVLQIDEAIEMLERQEHTKVKDEQSSARRLLEQVAEAKVSYSTKLAAVKKGKAERAAGKSKKGKSFSKVVVVPPWPERDVDLNAARQAF